MRPVFLALLLLFPSAPRADEAARVMEEVFIAAQRVDGSVAGQAIGQSAARIAAETPELAALVRQRQDLAEVLAGQRGRLQALATRSGSRAEVEAAGLAAAIAEGQVRLDALAAGIARDFPDFAALVDPQPMTVAEVQALLAPGEAVVLMLADREALFVWAISPAAARWTASEFQTGELEEMVARLRRSLSPGGGLRTAVALEAPEPDPGFDFATAHDLYLRTLAPLNDILRGAGHLLVVPDGPLTSLPPALLVTEPEGPAWLIRDHALTTLPSVAALAALRRARPRDDGPRQPFAGFGDPLLGYRLATAEPAGGGYITRGVYDDLRSVAQLAPLPGTARELRALARATGAGEDTIRLGAAATEAAVKAADLARVDVVVFATHGLLAEGLPGLHEPALVFSPPAVPSAADDALLTASEAAMLNLSARLVILSACDTAGSDGRPGAEGLSGLARAFIYAGARAILVSHWPVDDRAAGDLTTAMVGGMARGLTRAEALRQAMLALMATPGMEHPRYWAPFVVVGEGGADG